MLVKYAFNSGGIPEVRCCANAFFEPITELCKIGHQINVDARGRLK
jgi:hypothetical protein